MAFRMPNLLSRIQVFRSWYPFKSFFSSLRTPLCPTRRLFGATIWSWSWWSLYHRNSPFSPFSSLSFLGSAAGLSSLNPRFLNSSLAMRFLHTTSVTIQCQDSDHKCTYPSYSSDMISPNSDTPHRSSLSLFWCMIDSQSWHLYILLTSHLISRCPSIATRRSRAKLESCGASYHHDREESFHVQVCIAH